MSRKMLLPGFAATLLALTIGAAQAMDEEADAMYQEHCALCHGEQRIGGLGPALLPESLGRLKKAQAIDVVANGRPASQMIGYESLLGGSDKVEQLVEYLYTPADVPPTWTVEDTKATRKLFVDQDQLPDTPQHKSDPLNLFVVVEAGNHHVTILDGDEFEPVD